MQQLISLLHAERTKFWTFKKTRVNLAFLYIIDITLDNQLK